LKRSKKRIEPRKIYVKTKYRNIEKILAISSGKGGVGKSTISGFFSMYLAQKGYKVGLLDLDLYGPSCHLVLGANIKEYPKEEKGVVPPVAQGVYFMSSVFYTENRPLVVRGSGLNDAAIELLTITNWPDLDYLIIDMPPGLGDILLDVSELLPARFVVITNQSRISMESVNKLISYIKDQNLPFLGIVENMKMIEDNFIEMESKTQGIFYLGKVDFYPDIEKYYGNKREFSNSKLYEDISKIWEKLNGKI